MEEGMSSSLTLHYSHLLPIYITFTVQFCRFTAPFLENVAKFDESLIGLTFGLQILFGSAFAGYGSMKADELELKFPRKGRLYFLMGLLICGTIGFQLHFLIYYIAQHQEDDSQVHKIYHIIARILFSICSTLVFPILDGISLGYLKGINANEKDYGKERLFGAVTWAIASLIIGPLIDGYGFLNVFFWSSQASCIVSVVAIYYYMKEQYQHIPISESTCDHSLDSSVINVNKPIDVSNGETLDTTHLDVHDQTNESFCDAPRLELEMCKIEKTTCIENPKGSLDVCDGQSSLHKTTNEESLLILRSLFHGKHKIGFMISTITLSMGTSVVENLVFLFFQDELGGSNTICGLSILVTVIFEIPIFHYSAKLLSKYGKESLQKVACLAYVVRVVGYTLIPKDYVGLVLLFEPLHGVTYACSKTASVDFASSSSPPGFESTGQGLMSTFQGLGTIIGLSVGGWIEATFSAATLYRSYAVVVGVGLITFYISSSFRKYKRRSSTVYSGVSNESLDRIVIT